MTLIVLVVFQQPYLKGASPLLVLFHDPFVCLGRGVVGKLLASVLVYLEPEGGVYFLL